MKMYRDMTGKKFWSYSCANEAIKLTGNSSLRLIKTIVKVYQFRLPFDRHSSFSIHSISLSYICITYMYIYVPIYLSSQLHIPSDVWLNSRISLFHLFLFFFILLSVKSSCIRKHCIIFRSINVYVYIRCNHNYRNVVREVKNIFLKVKPW